MEEEEKVLLSFGRMHIDLIKWVVANNADTGMETVLLEADPRRYDWEEVDGLLKKSFRIYITSQRPHSG